MRVMCPRDRMKYLETEVKARIQKKNYLLRPGVYEPKNDEMIADLEAEIRELDDELEELDEALWSGKEIYK
jgi:type I restriction-modification system DNA methylase subunit